MLHWSFSKAFSIERLLLIKFEKGVRLDTVFPCNVLLGGASFLNFFQNLDFCRLVKWAIESKNRCKRNRNATRGNASGMNPMRLRTNSRKDTETKIQTCCLCRASLLNLAASWAVTLWSAVMLSIPLRHAKLFLHFKNSNFIKPYDRLEAFDWNLTSNYPMF